VFCVVVMLIKRLKNGATRSRAGSRPLRK
jgi:hypothetical protein